MATEIREVLPDPERLVEGLRDTGYQFNTAVADVVDNSVAAGAKNIAIELRLDLRGAVTLAIYDDGVGMDRDGLIDAMRYGARARPSPDSLGKFGLGLKTASTAFCRKLSVISRASPDATLVRATWDLDRIRDEFKAWKLVVDDPSEKQLEEFASFVPGGVGTLVLWEKVDRVLKSSYDNSAGPQAKKDLERMADGLRFHLSLVYQRFLDADDDRERTLKLKLNGRGVGAWDPFSEQFSRMVKEESMEVEIPGGPDAEFRIRAFILPRKEEFPGDDEAKAARITNLNQGFYVYRQNRLIHGPSSLGLFVKEPHLSLMRIEFSFDHRLDEAFQIDIKKSQIILDEGLRQHLLDFITPIRRAAEDHYRTGRRKVTHGASAGAHDVSNKNISGKAGQINQPTVKDADAAKGEATITNPQGTVRLKLKVATASSPAGVYVQTVEQLEDGLLWKPAIINGPDGKSHTGVLINTSHPYYGKVYVPNLAEGVTIQGMDALLWGLSVAELNCTSDVLKRLFDDVRFDVSRSLKRLVEDLPEPKLEG